MFTIPADHYLVKSLPGFSPAIGQLVCMLDYGRRTTLQAVAGLALDQLDFLLDDSANSIGMLLEHIGSIEVAYQHGTFGAGFEPLEQQRYQLGVDLGEAARRQIRGQRLGHYLDRLAAVRDFTLRELAKRDDTWLFQESRFWDGTGNHYFMWFHVLEDEINHRGQIRLIRKRLPSR